MANKGQGHFFTKSHMDSQDRGIALLVRVINSPRQDLAVNQERYAAWEAAAKPSPAEKRYVVTEAQRIAASKRRIS